MDGAHQPNEQMTSYWCRFDLTPAVVSLLVLYPGFGSFEQGVHRPFQDVTRAMNVAPEKVCVQTCTFCGQFQGFRQKSLSVALLAEPCPWDLDVAQTAASLTFLMNTNTGVFLNVNGFLCPLLDACIVSAHCRGRTWWLEFSSLLRAFFFFLSFSCRTGSGVWSLKRLSGSCWGSPVLNTQISKFQGNIYLPLWELLVLDGDSSCIRLAENLWGSLDTGRLLIPGE